MICAQVPVLAARPSALTVLPIQPTGSRLAEPSAQLQERPEDVSVPWPGITRLQALLTELEDLLHGRTISCCRIACRCKPSMHSIVHMQRLAQRCDCPLHSILEILPFARVCVRYLGLRAPFCRPRACLVLSHALAPALYLAAQAHAQWFRLSTAQVLEEEAAMASAAMAETVMQSLGQALTQPAPHNARAGLQVSHGLLLTNLRRIPY